MPPLDRDSNTTQLRAGIVRPAGCSSSPPTTLELPGPARTAVVGGLR